MAFLGLKYREDYWFFGGLLLALILGITAGLTLSIFFLAACTFLLVVVWLGAFCYMIFKQPGPFGAWLVFAIPIFVASTWVAVIVSVWGFWR